MSINHQQGFVLLLFALLLGTVAVIWSQNSEGELSLELKQRGLDEGLALISTTAGNHWDVVPLAGSPMRIDNPRGLSRAWFSEDGNVVAWSIDSWPGEAFAECPSPVIVETADGIQLWQLPGNVINSAAIAVSADGQRVAFDGTYKPNGTGFLNTKRNREGWITGLHLADQRSNSVSLILPLKDSFDGTPSGEYIGRISFAPGGNSFVYDFHDEIYIYDVLSKITTRIGSGSTPVWSPNGNWIVFRSPTSEAYIMDPKTRDSRSLIPGRKMVWGIHWSPDSQYVMFGQYRTGWVPIVSPSTELVVYRLRDEANTRVYGFAYTDRGSDGSFFWVKHSQQFLKNALIPAAIKPCQVP